MIGRRKGSLILCAAVIAAACGSSDPLGGVTMPGVSSTTATTTAGTPAALGPDGGAIELDTGVRIEAFAGSFAAEATITATSAGGGDLPPGLTAVGGSWSITATVPPDGPVLIGLPLPEGTDPADVAMLHTAADGTEEILGGFVEDGTYYAATTAFSDYRLVGMYLQGVLTLGTEAELPFNLGLPIEEAVIEPPEAGTLRAEYGGLVRGDVDAPRLRHITLYGPGEVAVGEETTFSVTGFDTLDPRFLQYDWSVAGAGLSISTLSDGARVLASGDGPGRALLMVEVTDPFTGATAFASRRVFVVEDTLTVSAIALRAPYYADGDGPVVTCAAFGGTPPYRWEWTWSDGASGSSDLQGPRITHSPIGSDLTLHVVVTDSTEVEAAATIAVRGLPYRSGLPAVMLSGPFEGEVGEELVYRIHRWQPEDGDEIGPLSVTLTGGAGTATLEGDEVRVTFDEPGLKGVIVEGASSLIYAAAGVRITGATLPYEAQILGLPDQVPAGTPVAFEIGARGGIIDVESTAYVVVLDFGDGERADLTIPATTAAEWSSLPIEHAWAEPGLHQVILQLLDGVTELARVTLNLEVLPGRIVAVGKFWTPDPESLPFPFEVAENRVRIVLDAGEVRIPGFALHTISVPWSGFELGSDETSEPTCAQHSESTLDSFEGSYDPATGAVTGTGVVSTHRVDIGTNCPFGGIDVTDLHAFELEATLAGGMISGRFQYVESEGGLSFEATVKAD